MPDQFIAFAIYAFVTSITPGPNNTMLLASGVNYGLVRSIPHILGVSLGFALMVLVIGAGLGEIFLAVPQAQTVLRWIGCLYLLWLAWKLATSGPMDNEAQEARPPLTFAEAALFQWVNPKCWIMAMGALTTYLPESASLWSVAVLALAFALVNAPSVGSWAAFGTILRGWLSSHKRMRAFNIVMALLLVASLHSIIS